MNIQNNPTYIDDEINPQLPLVDAHNHVIVDNLGEGNRGGNLMTHALKSTIGEMLTSLTLTGHLFYLLYHMVMLSW